MTEYIKRVVKKPTLDAKLKAWETLVSKERELLCRKGADYTAGRCDVDAYANFRGIAELLEGVPISPFSVALVYALKHMFSLITFAKSGKLESEGIIGRITDIRNYMFILSELVPDHQNCFVMKFGEEETGKNEEEDDVAQQFNDKVDSLIWDAPD